MPSRSYLQRLVGRDRVPQVVLTPPRSLFAPRSHLLANNDIASLSETRSVPLPPAGSRPAGQAPPPGTTQSGRGGPAETPHHRGAVAPGSTEPVPAEPAPGPRSASRPAVDRSTAAPIAAQERPAARATPSTAAVGRTSVRTSAKPAHEPSRERESVLPRSDAGRRSGFQPMSSPAEQVGDGAPPSASPRGRASVPLPPRPPQPAARDERHSANLTPNDAVPSDSVPRQAPGRSAANKPVSSAGAAKPRRTDARDVLSPLPPPRAAAHHASDAPQSAPASIRIGSLEVRVVAPQPAAPPAAAPPPRRGPVAPAKAPAAPLARGFRRFGLAQA